MTNTDTSLPLTATTTFQAKSGAGVILIDEGTATEEIAYATGLAGANLTIPLANRGLEGGTAQAHSSGATVKGVMTALMWNDVIDSLVNVLDATTGAVDTTKVVTLTGTQTLTNKTLTAPTITGPTVTGTVAGSATYTKPTLNGSVQAITANTDGATVTFNLAASNYHTVTLGGNRTLALSNPSVGQPFILRLLQDATGSRTVTWFTTIKWAGGVAPTLTTTASKADVLGFVCTGSGTYDGFIVGSNL